MGAFFVVALVIAAALAGLAWLGAMWTGTSAVHQILAAIYALIVVLALVGLGVGQAVGEMTNRLPKPRPPAPK